ncbi:nicotinate-nucleotide adenylyltransferase [Porphyromonadaceae bacterium KH3R12]|jgi:nicotinate-nucleotide adenylyltransferase|uniref:nicotinate (nicotinamide) nucleotide adenylyltransferase n=1 Tax=Proteiniphilum TaxID=294702 RepID=UPI00089C1FF1|nr:MULTISPECIES: nicotinate (nicotinamide) nucleotide adenylyltransferase [Proteiniphilum]MDY9917424.1 nicotinate (nicotinamide) nucleotide adenylyltransferase [Proteiniphilum sp.]SEA29517.1 nicotinate-nucleotide adenylyltransferase [Porphyromonadaceae bacterium KH3R12]
MQKKSVGIFSGSFNPIHIGHLILANYICEFTDLDEVWFVVSPHNPLKEAKDLLDDDLRLEIVRLALEEFTLMKVSDVEFHMPRPSYTIDTLTKLTGEYPDNVFTLIIGGDNWKQFYRWKEFDRLIKNYQIFIYPRLGEEVVIPTELQISARLIDAPVVEISSTFIRESIRNGKNMRSFLPPKVYDFITKKGLYR